MEEKKNQMIDQETGEIIENDVEEKKKPQNLRVVKVLFLGGVLFDGDKKKKKAPGCVLAFCDAVEIEPKTGQPVLRGFNPVITTYVQNPSREILSLLSEKVFTTKFIKISGNEDYTKFHSVLTEQEITIYRQLMGEYADM